MDSVDTCFLFQFKMNRHHLKNENLYKGDDENTNKFKGPSRFKAVKLWAGLYLIQLYMQLCYPSFL